MIRLKLISAMTLATVALTSPAFAAPKFVRPAQQLPAATVTTVSNVKGIVTPTALVAVGLVATAAGTVYAHYLHGKFEGAVEKPSKDSSDLNTKSFDY